jgi:methylthioribose-1-phosphate isomerase
MFQISDIQHHLPFILQPDNIARFFVEDDGQPAVAIGNRSKYPHEKSFVICHSVEEVAAAIEQMVTQGAGPWQAAACGLALAGYEIDQASTGSAGGLWHVIALERMQAAQQRLVATRPTNTAMARRLELAMGQVELALKDGRSLNTAMLDWLHATRTTIYHDYAKRGRLGADFIEDGDGILTMCFAEAAFILTLAFAQADGKHIHVYVPETRPFLQGAKLTAPSIHELGIPVTLMGDNMASGLMAQGKIQKYFTAADLITLDGHVVNKVGTFQHAIAANYHNIPYYAFAWGFDPNRPNRESIEIEMRNPAEMKQALGRPTTHPDIPATYPAFDITPPELVTGVITKDGVLRPDELGVSLK